MRHHKMTILMKKTLEALQFYMQYVKNHTKIEDDERKLK